MTMQNESLVRDLVAWVAETPRPYAEVMEAWRTSCPRLTIWEDCEEAGYVERVRDRTGACLVRATAQGREMLRDGGSRR